MKKLILGIAMFIGGIFGMIGVLIATAIQGEGFEMQGATICILDAGMMHYFIIFIIMSMIGIGIAYKDAFR